MYSENNTVYTENHSISFGDIVTRTTAGVPYEDFDTVANTWETWHLIPASRPSIAHPNVVLKFVEQEGKNGMLDLSDFFATNANYGQRQGSLSFYVANYFEDWTAIQNKIYNVLHGKRIKMRLMDDPDFYYEGRFTVGQWESGASNSKVSIGYQLAPFKKRIGLQGSSPVIWDTFNFEKDYDYYTVMSPLRVSGSTKTYTIMSGNFSFAPVATWVSGNITLSFGGITGALSSSNRSIILGRSSAGANILTASGNGSATITWREEAL